MRETRTIEFKEMITNTFLKTVSAFLCQSLSLQYHFAYMLSIYINMAFEARLNAAGILADKNHFPGIDIVRFGENISVIHKRATL